MSRETLTLDEAPLIDEHSLVNDLAILTKARLSLLVIVTTFLGFMMASHGAMDWVRLIHATLGTALAAASAAVFNQVMEKRVDRLMERTRHRPLPAGRFETRTAIILGTVLGVLGISWLAFFTNSMAAWLAGATIFVYIALYTPLKRRTALCTLVGAVSGAIPPMIGWVAARPSFDAGAWVLFAILFTWQMPHFLAIAWMYKDEYASAGFVMLPRNDHNGSSTAIQAFLFAIALAMVTVAPFNLGMCDGAYLSMALVLDLAFLLFAAAFVLERNTKHAKRLFFASIIYLPLLLGLMVITKS